MKRIGAVLAGVLLAAAVPRATPRQDAAVLLAAARQALGGDAALSAISSFTATGHVDTTHPPAPPVSSSLEIFCQLPDKHVEVRRRTVRTPIESFEITTYRGAAGQEPIHSVVAPSAPFPMVLPAGPPPATAAEIAAAKERSLALEKRQFARVLAALFAGPVGDYPMRFAAAAPVPTGEAIDVTGPGGATFRLLLDRASHLPVKVAWKDRPIVVMSRSSTVVVGRGGVQRQDPMSSLPSGDPTAGLPDADWEMTIDGHRLEDGVNWPRRLTTTIDGKRYEEIRISRFRLNQKIDPGKFTPPRG